MKTCTKCKIDKEDNEFYSDSRRKDGLRSWCKSCSKKDNEKRDFRYNETRKEYRKNHKEEYRFKKKEYYDNNKESVLSGHKLWRQTLNGKLFSYKRASKTRGIDWNLTKEEFESLWNKNCHYCGCEIITIGIDRIDSDKGYQLGNIIPCCTSCNMMKSDTNYEVFISNISKIYKNLKL